jgi:hypothetical protein
LSIFSTIKNLLKVRDDFEWRNKFYKKSKGTNDLCQALISFFIQLNKNALYEEGLAIAGCPCSLFCAGFLVWGRMKTRPKHILSLQRVKPALAMAFPIIQVTPALLSLRREKDPAIWRRARPADFYP